MSGYTKLFSSIVGSTIWREPPTVKVVWVTMLAMADRDGIVEASVPGLADLARVTRAEVEHALSVLLAPDPDSRSKALDGRRIVPVDGGWQLVNHAKYREKMASDERRERNADYMREYRQRKPYSGQSGQCKARVSDSGENGQSGTSRSDPSPSPKADTEDQTAESDARPPEPELESGTFRTAAAVDFTDSDRQSVCPPDLHIRARKAGVLGDIAQATGADVDALFAAAESYVAHFVIGRGVGKQGNRWMGRLRGVLVTKAREPGGLKAVGLLEHEGSKGPGGGLPDGWTRHPTLEGHWLDRDGKTRKRPPGGAALKAVAS